MPSINASSPSDVFPIEAIEALRRTRPWILFLAIITTIGAFGAVVYAIYFALMAGEHHLASTIYGSIVDRLIAEVTLLGILPTLLAVMQFRFVAQLSTLAAAVKSQESVNIEKICRRQLQLWSTLAIVFGGMLAFNLFHLIELAAHTNW